jgi:hypothetical protein
VPNEPFPLPPDDFCNRSLTTIYSAGIWYRLNPVGYESSLYFDRSGKGRFDSPTQGYGILYTGEDQYTLFIECFGRELGTKVVAESDIQKRNLFSITASRPLCLVDLTGEGLVKIGADAGLSSGRDYTIPMFWAKAIWEHPAMVDGIRYRSRHDPSWICCGLFDRAKNELQENNLGDLVNIHPELLAKILMNYGYSLL